MLKKSIHQSKCESESVGLLFGSPTSIQSATVPERTKKNDQDTLEATVSLRSLFQFVLFNSVKHFEYSNMLFIQDVHMIVSAFFCNFFMR